LSGLPNSNMHNNDAVSDLLRKNLFKEWGNGLKDAADNLDGISSKVEKEFLNVGDKLRDYNFRVKEIYQLSYETGELISSDNISHAIDGLNKILESINQFTNNSDASSEEGGRKFKEIVSLLENGIGQLAGFKRIVKKLRMLGISNRIESSRLKGNFEDFNVLANTVEELSGKIGSKAGDIKLSSENIIKIIAQNTAGIEKLRGKKKDYSERIIKDTKVTLQTLTDRHSMALISTKDILERSEIISRDISEIVHSLQFHDITRQKFEHVVSALLEPVKKIENLNNNEEGVFHEDAKKALYLINSMAGLQSAQLFHTQEEFASAVDRIMNSLLELSHSVNLMRDKALEVGGGANDTSNSFLTEMENNLSGAAQGMLESGKINDELAASMSSIAETLNNLTSFVDEIDEISSEIEMIAINSNIKSAHTGTEGAALGVLADSIKSLSVDAREQTTMVSESLLEIARLSDEIKKLINANEKKQAVENSKEIINNLGGFLNSRLDLSLTISKNLTFLGEKVFMLSKEIEADVKALKAGEGVLRTSEKTIFMLERICKETESYIDGDKSGEYEETLKELESLYTMNSEREVHKFFEEKRKNKTLKVNLTPLKKKEVEEESVSEFGDNVELF